MSYGFVLKFFIFGGIGCIFEDLGCICLNHAYSKGATGKCVALMQLSIILLTIIECIRHLAIPNYLQIIGMLVGIMGALVLTVPDELRRIFLRSRATDNKS